MRARHSTHELRLQIGLGFDVRDTLLDVWDLILNVQQLLGYGNSVLFTANADRLMDMDMGNCFGHVHNEENHDANG